MSTANRTGSTLQNKEKCPMEEPRSGAKGQWSEGHRCLPPSLPSPLTPPSAQGKGGPQGLSLGGGQLGQEGGFSRGIETKLVYTEGREATRESSWDIWLRRSQPVTCTEHFALTQGSWPFCIPPTLKTLKSCHSMSADMSPDMSLSSHKGITFTAHRRWPGMKRLGTEYTPTALYGMWAVGILSHLP